MLDCLIVCLELYLASSLPPIEHFDSLFGEMQLLQSFACAGIKA